MIFSYAQNLRTSDATIMLTTKEKMTTEALAGAFLRFFISVSLCDVFFYARHTNKRFYARVRKFVFVERFEFGLHQRYASRARMKTDERPFFSLSLYNSQSSLYNRCHRWCRLCHALIPSRYGQNQNPSRAETRRGSGEL